MNEVSIAGSIVALVTPMTKNGEVDYSSLDHLVDFHLQNNTDGLVVLGTTGESVTLNDEEREKIICRVVDRVGGRIPVIVGTGHNCTKKTILETQKAKACGADLALIVTPYYNKPTQEGLIAHYRAVANAVDIPIILYNVPGRTACDMLPQTTAALSAESNIIGIKEASADPNRINDLVKYCPANFSLLTGEDGNIIEFLTGGGHGIISVTANVVPSKVASICSIARDGDLSTAKRINTSLLKLHKNLFVVSNPMPVKWALYHLGLISTDFCRLPLLPLELKYHKDLVTALEEAEALAALNSH